MRRQAAGGTPAFGKGSPESRRHIASATIDRAAAVFAAAVALGAALLAVSLSFGGTVDPGAVVDDPGGDVREVTPGGFAWNSGIRPGQRVIALTAADDPAGWSLTATDGEHEIVATAAAADAALRASWPLAMLAVAAAVLAIASVRRPARGVALAALSLLAASVPARLHGDATLALAIPLAAGLTPGVWLTRWGHSLGRWRVAAVAGVGTVLLIWLAARVTATDSFDIIDIVQPVVVIAAVGITLAAETGLIGAGVKPRVRAIDLAWLGAVVALASLLLVLGDVDPLYIAFGLVVLMGIYAPIRRVAIRALDRLLLSDMRDRTSIQATEDERARLARDLHDAPLQELAGVIQRLELVPEAQGEGNRLRAVAEQLRAVATDLRPPVLDDLGLPAAVKFLGNHPPVSGGVTEIQVAIDGQTGLRPDERPPNEVELATFRIIQEALSNSLRHSGATSVRISGTIARDQILIAVRDDGAGMPPEARVIALQRGRLGLDSMHRRAEAVGGRLSVGSILGGGTLIEFEWQR
jgi:signal transduction histidine kinase